MKRILPSIIRFTILLAFAACCATGRAQTTATWIGPATGGEWNTDANWNTGLTPGDSTTNAFIGVNTNVNYNLPMAAASIGIVTNFGVLNVNTNGFVIAPGANPVVFVSGTASRLFVNNGGLMNLAGGDLQVSNLAALVVSPGGTLTVNGTILAGAGTGNGGDKAGVVTNNGGTISATGLRISPNNQNANCRVVINGGTNDLGDVLIQRSNLGSFGAPGPEGLLIFGGLIRMNSLDVGGAGNSFLTMLFAGGVMTNTGNTIVQQITAARASRYLQTGGLFVSSGGVNLRGNSVNNAIAIYSVTGGTNIVSGFVLGNPAATDTTGTIRLTNAAKIYVGSGGFTSIGTLNTKTIALNSGGIFGADADWTGTEPFLLAGGAFEAADLSGTPHNIGISGVISGTANLNKTGTGKLTLSVANNYTGGTTIHQGVLALDTAGSIASSSPIIVSSSGVFDVSAVSGGFTHSASRTLGGFGGVAGAVASASGSIINPGSNLVTGTLTFSNSVTQTGGAINHFDLSSNPSGPNNDFVVIGGDLNISGVNSIEVSGGGPPGSIHPLIHYVGSLNGDVTANLAVTGATGSLSNNAGTKTIYLILASATRAPTNVTWTGNSVANVWDTLNVTNWLNSGVLDFFVAGDQARFDLTGASHPLIDVVGTVSPGSMTVDTISNYTFTGAGLISGGSGLNKTNSGTLTILTTNSFSGVVTIGGGTIEASTLPLSGGNSSIGAAPADPSFLQFYGGTLRYLGDTASTDRGATLNAGGGIWDVASNATILTFNGSMAGSGGSLVKAGPGTLALAAANTYSGGTVISNGALQLNVAGAAGAAPITNYNSRMIVGAFTMGNALDFNGTSIVDLNNAGNNAALVGAWSGNGTVNVTNQANLITRVFTVGGGGSGTMANFSGTISMGTCPGELRFNDGGGDGGGPNFGSANATFDLGISTANLHARNGGTFNHLGALLGGPGTFLSGNTANAGTVTYSIGGKNLSTTFEGIIRNGNNPTAIIKVGGGTLTLRGNSTYTGATTISNGVLALQFNGGNDGSIDNSLTITIVSPGILDVSGRSDGQLLLGGGQTLRGNGTVQGSLTVVGTLAPGFSIGTITVTNLATLLGTARMEINRAGSPNSDRLVANSIALGGQLVVTNIGPPLQVGDTFDLLDGALSGGFFGNVVLPNYYSWDTNNLEINGTISVTAILPGPSFSSIDGSLISSGLVSLNVTNGAPNGGYVIMTSTNLILPVNSWTPVVTNVFDSLGNFSAPEVITVDPTTPQQFFLLKVF